MNILEALATRRTRRRTLTSLRHLDTHLLRDIGLDRDIHGRIAGLDFVRLQDLGR